MAVSRDRRDSILFCLDVSMGVWSFAMRWPIIRILLEPREKPMSWCERKWGFVQASCVPLLPLFFHFSNLCKIGEPHRDLQSWTSPWIENSASIEWLHQVVDFALLEPSLRKESISSDRGKSLDSYKHPNGVGNLEMFALARLSQQVFGYEFLLF